MTDTAADFLQPASAEAPEYDVSSQLTSPAPPPYDAAEPQPPPYSAAPEMYPSPKGGPNYAFEPSDECPPVSNMNPEDSPVTTQPVVASAFEDKTVRRGFVRKVFCIVTLMLLFTFSVVCLFTFSTVVKKAVKDNLWAYLSSIIVFVIVATALSCCQSFSRRHPWNIVGLVLVTLSMSYMVGTVASYHNTTSVVISIGVTLAISVAIIAFSAQTRLDFTPCYGIMLILCLDLVMFGIFSSFYYSHMADIAYGCLGALLFSLFLMIDVQLLMGSMSYRLDPEEYVNAALVIYLDIVLIFLYLMGRR